MKQINYKIDVNVKKGAISLACTQTDENGLEENVGEIYLAPVCELLDKLSLTYLRRYLNDRDNRYVDAPKNSDEAQLMLALKEETQMQPWRELADSSIERYVGRTCYFLAKDYSVGRGKIAETAISFGAAQEYHHSGRIYDRRHQVHMSFKVEVDKCDGSIEEIPCDEIFFNSEDAFKALDGKSSD